MRYDFQLFKTNAKVYLYEYKRTHEASFLKLAIHYTRLALSIRNEK